MGDKGQVATEYLIIMGFIVVVLVPITLLYIRYSGESNDSVTSSKVEHITNEIAAAADSVYAYGEGSQTKLELDFPSNIKEIKFVGKEVIFTVINSKNQESEIVQVTDVEFMGNSNIYLMPGKKEIIVKTVYDPVSGTNKVSVTMPCNNGDVTCNSCNENNFYGFCRYECINQVMTLRDLCNEDNCDEVSYSCVKISDCDVNSPCTSVYSCSASQPLPNQACGEPYALNVCCPDEGED